MVERVADAVARPLREMGFKRRPTTWNRRISDFTDVIDLQLSKSQDRVWVNVGVAEAQAYVSVWGRALPSFVLEGECSVRARLGVLIDGHDSAWMIRDLAAPTDIENKLRTVGLPYLERLHTYEELDEEMASRPGRYPPEVIGHAVIRAKLGDTPGACELLENLIANGPGEWLSRIESVHRQLGCRKGT